MPRRVAVDEHEAAVRLDGAVHDGEPEAAAAGLRREERVEQAVADLGGMPGPSSVTRSATPPWSNATPAGSCSGERRRDLDAHLAALRRRLHRVEREVEHGAVQQVLVAVDDQCSLVRRRTTTSHAVRAVGMRRGERSRRRARRSPRSTGSTRATRTRAKSRNSVSSRDSRSDSRTIERARASARPSPRAASARAARPRCGWTRADS